RTVAAQGDGRQLRARRSPSGPRDYGIDDQGIAAIVVLDFKSHKTAIEPVRNCNGVTHAADFLVGRGNVLPENPLAVLNQKLTAIQPNAACPLKAKVDGVRIRVRVYDKVILKF